MSSIVFWLCCQLPQLIKNYQRGAAEALSAFFLAQWLLGDILNFAGSYLSGVVVTQLYLAGWFVIIDVIILSQYTYYTIKNRNKQILTDDSDDDAEEREPLNPKQPSVQAIGGRFEAEGALNGHFLTNGNSHLDDGGHSGYTPPTAGQDDPLQGGSGSGGMRRGAGNGGETGMEPHALELGPEAALILPEGAAMSPASTRGTRSGSDRGEERGHETTTFPPKAGVAGRRSPSQCSRGAFFAGVVLPAVVISLAGPASYHFATTASSSSSSPPSSGPRWERGLHEEPNWFETSPVGNLTTLFPARVGGLPPFQHRHVAWTLSPPSSPSSPSSPPYLHTASAAAPRQLDIHPCKSKHTISKQAATAGAVMGWISSVLYINSRLPQIYKNCKRGNVEGLSWLMFFCAFMGNITSTLGIVMRATSKADWVSEAPFLPGMMGTVGFDFTIMTQYAIYTRRAKRRREERARLRQEAAEAAAFDPSLVEALEDTPQLPRASEPRHGLFDMVESPREARDIEQARIAVERAKREGRP